MNANIRFTGLTYQPSDYDCPDGTFDYITNAINDNGYLKALTIDKNDPLFIEPGYTPLYIHDGRYILQYQSGYFCYATKEQLKQKSYPALDSNDTGCTRYASINIHEVTAIGNTLLILTSEGIYYYLWQGNGYKYLGNHIPEIDISFGLDSEVQLTERTNFSETIYADYGTYKFSEWHKKVVTNEVLAKVNKFIKERAMDKNKFMYPFFVRYALRLYDGTHTMHSAPILMIPSTKSSPHVLANMVYSPEGGNDYEIGFFQVAAVLSELDYHIYTSDGKAWENPLLGWHDIVKSVDIFVSQPIYTYDQSGECENMEPAPDIFSDFAVTKLSAKYSSLLPHNKHAFSTLLLKQLTNGKDKDGNDLSPLEKTLDKSFPPTSDGYVRIALPNKGELVIDAIKNVSAFYHIASIDIKDLSEERKIVEIKKDTLNTLTVRETLKDDYESHDHLSAKFAYTYNNRLNIANIEKRLFKGYNPASMVTFTEVLPDNPDLSIDKINTSFTTTIRPDLKTIVVKSDNGSFSPESTYYLYYPNTEAKRINFANGDTRYNIELEQSSALNGAFWFRGWEGTLPITTEAIPSKTEDNSVKYPNKIYTSEINNPFVFRPKNINTIGDGEILNITSSAKAISEGQFGQYPLYAFTTEGVWAMEVSSQGGYSTKQPVSREVLTNPKSVLQIDNAVLFSSKRGVMLLQGANTTCITDGLIAQTPFDFYKLPKIDKFFELAGKTVPALPTFKEYLDGCVMAYDYINQRIFLSNEKYTHTWCYSLRSKFWSQVQFVMYSTLNSYPEAEVLLGMQGKCVLYNLSDMKSESNPATKAVFITRPFKLGAPDIYKTIDNILIRGLFKENRVKQVLYGTRDYVNWVVVYSSNNARMHGIGGTPYKAFRLAVIADLDNNESISEATINYDTKYTTKHR